MNKDYNLNYNNKNDPEIIEGIDVDLQAFQSSMLLSVDEIYFGSGNELGLPESVFDDIDLLGSQNSLDIINEKLLEFNPDINLDLERSSVKLINAEEVELTLVFITDNLERKLVRRLSI